MKDNTETIRSMALVSIHGLTVVVMKVTGTKESSMVSAHTWSLRTIKSSMVSGKMVNVSNGSTNQKLQPSTHKDLTTPLISIKLKVVNL